MINHVDFNGVFGLDNLYKSWRLFRRGKSQKSDVLGFERHLEDNLFALHNDLITGVYKHGSYNFFQTYDNKKRDIYVASVRDRVVHRLVYDYLVRIYEPLFISNTYSSRKGKGSHRAVKTFRYFANLIKGKKLAPCFVLKCDIKKYFCNINQEILLTELKKNIPDGNVFYVTSQIVRSFYAGTPLGNVTSQIFSNIYLNIFDSFVKNNLGVRFYIRYNDDFVILAEKREQLGEILIRVKYFLSTELRLEIPAHKASIRKLDWGVDFLGYTILPNGILLRTRTKARMYEKVNRNNINSYVGLMKHCDSYNLCQKVISLL
jgi:RNA-directed DNA polymerase